MEALRQVESQGNFRCSTAQFKQNKDKSSTILNKEFPKPFYTGSRSNTASRRHIFTANTTQRTKPSEPSKVTDTKEAEVRL